MKKKIIWSVIIVGLFYLLIISIDKAKANDPLPNYAYGQEVIRIQSASGQSQSDWEKTEAYKNFTCPEGTSGGIGVDMNFTTTSSDDFYFAYCWKSYKETTVTLTESATVTTQSVVTNDTPTVTTAETITATIAETTTATIAETTTVTTAETPAPTSSSSTTSEPSSSTSSSTTTSTTTTTSSLYEQIMALFQQLFVLLAKFIK